MNTSLPQATLPEPSAEALVHSQRLTELIQSEIETAGGWIDFAHFMHLALYAPSLGYYSGGSKKFGKAGDFVTAPEISPLFAQTLAKQVQQVLALTQGDVLELGAGTGKLAATLLLELQQAEQLSEHYYILEVSAYLRDLQRETLQSELPAELFERVIWLDTLPETFNGLILGNEVLDALPVHIIKTHDDSIEELGVSIGADGFEWKTKVLKPDLQTVASKLSLTSDYTTEICPAATGLITSLTQLLEHGVILMLDYGFPQREYYHPQRAQGTLMCHYRHYAHDNPFLYVGLQDITAHVDFTAIAEAGMTNGAELLGYANQAQFLINCGITDVLSQVSPENMLEYVPLASQAQKLLSPAEMGELFKVIALGKGISEGLLGFSRGDRSHTL
ncbi:class I SAM-dependent methyltransferase [Methyloradius palustris]|uniref:SAM-dependent methyltransferase n=1 Tax=Methyloradius palustris TaxID=2778876 RepID=A0A8D5JPX9_9PROT|nr:SAM-dependent methyltransferase [Methyloradius palustris]BCM23966.1 SAM-dependent methyltransferase [Methyloradius palustris]